MVLAAVVALAGGGATYMLKREADAARECEASKAGQMPIHANYGDTPAVILGDSYTQGLLLQDRSAGWAFKVSRAQGWEATVAGVGSTGFVNGGPCGDQIFGDRIDEAIAGSPEILVIQGGVNDYRKDIATIESSADETLRRAGSVERVVVIGPAPAPARDNLDKVDASLAAVAKLNGREYISAHAWDDLEFMPDGVHLTESGHARFAERVAAAIRR